MEQLSRGYTGLAKSRGGVQEDLILGEMGGAGHQRVIAYRRFVEAGLREEIDNPLQAVQWQAALGSEGFLRRIQDRMNEVKGGRGEVTALRQGAKSVPPEKVVAAVARHYGVRAGGEAADALMGEARNVALWLVWEKCGLSQREIGEMFGQLDAAAVASA